MYFTDIAIFLQCLLLAGAQATEPRQNVTIGILDRVGLEMQNAYLFNLVSRYLEEAAQARNDTQRPDILVASYETQAEVTQCLTDGDCIAGLDYVGGEQAVEAGSGLGVLPLKILDDPVLDMIMPRGTLTVGRLVIVTIQWLPSIFAVLLLGAIFISRAPFLSKPIKQDARTTPISDPGPGSVELFSDQQEDFFLRGVRNGNAALTCRNNLDSPLAQGLAGVVLLLAYWVLIISISTSASIEVARNLST